MKIKTLYIDKYKVRIGYHYKTFNDELVDEIFEYKNWLYILSEGIVIAKFKKSKLIGFSYK